MTLRNAFADLALDATVSAVLTKLNAGLAVTNFPGSQAVTGTFWQATQPVSAASLPLPTGAATETTLAALNTKTPSNGQAVMSASRPVVIASNQSAIPVTGTFWQATQPVSFTWAGLTDTQLRATALSVIPNITRGSGVVDANTQRVTLATDGPTVTALSNIDSKTPALVGGASPVVDAPGNALLTAIQANSASIEILSDTLVNLLSAIFEKMPSLTSGDRIRASVVIGETSNELNSAYGGVSSNWAGEQGSGRQFGRILEPLHFSDAGSVRIYNQIIVT